jgi:hypothetical protein
MGWCVDFRAAHPEKNLTHLYQDLLPRLYGLLLGGPADNVVVDSTAHLLRLAPDTALLPRFRFARLFIDPSTRAAATGAYNEAVAGSTIYTLDKFGAGALPFDLVIPEQGRGTLRLTPRVLFVETRQPIAVGLKKPIESIEELAEVVVAKFGDHVTLVGKAVSLISMLAHEFIFVFNEEGSSYVRYTRRMNDILAGRGVDLDLRPILRMRYHTWDSLEGSGATLSLPEHLASAFGQQSISAPQFGVRWSAVIEQQRELCETIKDIRKPLDLLEFVGSRDPEAAWDSRIAEYRRAREVLAAVQQELGPVKERVRQLYEELRASRGLAQGIQRKRGEHFRAAAQWTADALAVRDRFARELDEIETRKRHIRSEIAALNGRRHERERGPEAEAARSTLRGIEDQAEMARLRLIRNATLTIDGLKHTNHRPSAWWLPMVDPTGQWFKRIATSAELYTEPLLSR